MTVPASAPSSSVPRFQPPSRPAGRLSGRPSWRPFWRPRSVRTRLTLWYVCAVAIILGLYALVVFTFLHNSLWRSLDEQLHADIQMAESLMARTPDGIGWKSVPQFDRQHEGDRVIEVWNADATRLLLQLPGPNEEDLAFGPDDDGHRLTLPPLSRTGVPGRYERYKPQHLFTSLTLPDGVRLRVLAEPYDADGTPVLVRVARSEEALHRELRDLALFFGLAFPAALAAAGCGGYLLARRALAPVDRIAERARAITADHLHERIPVENPDDELGRLASVLNDTLARLDEAFASLRRFTADASHELRTPLTAIRGVGEVGLQERRDEEGYRAVIGKMLEDVDRLTRLVDVLLILSRAETGRLTLTVEPVDLAMLAREVTMNLDVLVEEKRQMLTVDVEEGVIVQADHALLRSALTNVIDNAIKYSPESAPIAVHVVREGQTAVIAVEDRGPGIAEVHHARLFDRFYRVDEGRSRDRGGMGLGLAIARWAVEANGGRIDLRSREGHGSTFRLVFPLVLALLICLGPWPGRVLAQAQTPAPSVASSLPRSAVVTATSAPIAVDAVLDEPIWSAAPGIGDLVQREPNEGATPTERTDVILLYDQDHLYIGVRAYDSEPHRVIGTQMARDGNISSDDRLELLLDTFRDQRSAFYFATNPSGALVDGLIANDQLNSDWDAIWDVRTRRTAEGWVAEFAIPFKSLSFPASATTWRFNIARTIYRKLEDVQWSGARFDTQFLQVSEAGEITQLVGLSQGIGLDVRPFLAGRWLRLAGANGVGADTNTDAEPGLDVFYNITPSLKLTTTVNTDFGETEVDARQINLSRFSLLFPEKRSFFLEGAGVFNFASTGPAAAGGIPATGADVFPFFSRQIGLLSGQEVPIDVGVKLTGTVGRTDVGVLNVRTGDLPIVDAKNFFVGRVKRNLLQQSYVGAIFTNGHPASGRAGQTYGADIRLATSRFLNQPRNFVVDAYAARSVNEGVSGDDWSYGFSASYPNDKYAAQFSMREIQKNFKPALGFVQRENVRMIRAAGSYNPRPKHFLNVQQMFHDVYFTHFTRVDNGEVESWDLYVTLLDWHLYSGDNFHGMLDFNPTFERLFEPFEISPGVILQPGDYRFTRFRSSLLSTATKRRLSGSATLTYGDYWSGQAEQLTTSLTYKLPPRFTFVFSTNQTFARLPEGRFIARIFTSNVNYAFSPRLALTNLVQYDNRSRNLGWQSRLRWTLRPGSDFFFAFNQGWIQEDINQTRRFRSADSRASAKFQYSLRF